MNQLRRLLLLIIILVSHLYLLINTTFTLWPEMIVYPYLLNNKFLLYRDIINPYTPLLTEFLGVFSKRFGYNPLPYQILTWSLIILIDLLIFYFSAKISKSFNRAIFATLFFVVFSVPFAVNGLWFDLVQAPFIIISIYLFYSYLQTRKSKQLLFSFALLSVAFFIKQQAIWIIFSYILILLANKHKKLTKRIQIISISLIPLFVLFIISSIFFASKGLLQDFLYWAFYFPFVKSRHLPGYILFPNLKQVFVILLSYIIFLPVFTNKKSPKILLFFSLILLLSAFPRFDYFHLIPSFAILAILFSTYKLKFNKHKLISAISISSLILFSVIGIRFYQRNWNHKVRFFEDDVLTAASLIRFIGSPSPIYIQNGPDQIYPLSQTLPVKPWADEFPWYLENSNLQNKVVDALKAENPKIILYQPYSQLTKFSLGTYRPQKISDYLDENYISVQKITDSLILKKKK